MDERERERAKREAANELIGYLNAHEEEDAAELVDEWLERWCDGK